jgi:hypothetical protein
MAAQCGLERYVPHRIVVDGKNAPLSCDHRQIRARAMILRAPAQSTVRIIVVLARHA